MSKDNLKSMRDGYGAALLYLGKINPKVVCLTADLESSTRLEWFAQKYPARFFEIGISEQDLVGQAAGLSLAGKIPFVATYGVFCPGRCWDQIRVTVAYSQLNVKLSGAHAGLTVGPDGATHQALEDLTLMRVLPNFTVLSPADYWQTYQATLAAANLTGPVYLRFSRNPSPIIFSKNSKFVVGKAQVLTSGKSVTIIATGLMVAESLRAAKILAQQKISAEVINLHTIKPIDAKAIILSAKKTGCVVTAEEHQINGGLGSAVAEVLVQNYPVPQEFIGMRDSFGQSGQPQELLDQYQLNAAAIVKKVLAVVKRKKLN